MNLASAMDLEEPADNDDCPDVEMKEAAAANDEKMVVSASGGVPSGCAPGVSSSSGCDLFVPNLPLADELGNPVTSGVAKAESHELQNKPRIRFLKIPVVIDERNGRCSMVVVVDERTGIPLERSVTIINKQSGRKLYAKVGYNWEHKVGAGSPTSDVHDDGNWRITPDGDGFRIINQESARCLYAKNWKNWENGVGAGSPPDKVDDDGVWYIIPEGDGFRIINKESQRCLYAALGWNWLKKVGAGWPSNKVHGDGIWYIDLA